MFANPGLLILAIILPALMALALALYVRRRRRAAAGLGDRALVRRLLGADLYETPWARIAMMLVAAAVLGIAAADPRWGLAQAGLEGPALDLVLVLDVSNSMRVADAAGTAMTRLEAERRASRRLARELEGDRVGIVVFAGRAYILSPLTSDRGAVELYLDALGPSIVEQTGSSLSVALRQATNLVTLNDRGDEGSRVLVLMSDGDAFEEPEVIQDAARRAARAGVTVYTVGTGTEQGAPVPDVDPATGEQQGFKTDPMTGETAVSRLNEPLLRDIAAITGGDYVHLADEGAVGQLLEQLRAEERGTGGNGEGSGRTQRQARYGWFVAMALLLLAADAWWERRRD